MVYIGTAPPDTILTVSKNTYVIGKVLVAACPWQFFFIENYKFSIEFYRIVQFSIEFYRILYRFCVA